MDNVPLVGAVTVNERACSSHATQLLSCACTTQLLVMTPAQTLLLMVMPGAATRILSAHGAETSLTAIAEPSPQTMDALMTEPVRPRPKSFRAVIVTVNGSPGYVTGGIPSTESSSGLGV